MSAKFAPTYPIPIRYIQTKTADMLFWDVVYFLLAHRGRRQPDGAVTVESSDKELLALSSISPAALKKLRNSLHDEPEPYRIHLIDGGMENHIRYYDLEHPNYNKAVHKKAIQKPQSYVHLHWLSQIRQSSQSRFPFAILNVLFQSASNSLTFTQICEKTRKRDKNGRPARILYDEVGIGLNLLLQMGLVFVGDEDVYQINMQRFMQLPTYDQSRQHPAIQQALHSPDYTTQQIDFALQLVHWGHFNIDTYFFRILSVLRYAPPDTESIYLSTMKGCVRRHAEATVRWKYWRERSHAEIQRRNTQVCGPKTIIHLDKLNVWPHHLTYPQTAGKRPTSGKLLAWLNNPYNLPFSGEIICRLMFNGHQLIQFVYTFADGNPKRLILPQYVLSAALVEYVCHITIEEALPDISLELALEISLT